MERTQKRRSIWLPLILAFAVGIAVIITLTTVINPVTVVVAAYDLQSGVTLTSDMLGTVTIPSGGKPSNAFTRIQDVVGQQLAVARVKGDFILESTLGTAAAAGIPGMLAPDHVAVAIHVDLATGLAGLLRPGQSVMIIGMLTPEVMQNTGMLSSSLPLTSNIYPTYEAPGPGTPSATMTPTATITPALGPVARIAITGVRVLLVPYSFRYEEPSYSAESDSLGFSAASMSQQQQSSVVILDVPVNPVDFAGIRVSPAVLITALDKYGMLSLALESAKGVDLTGVLTLNLSNLYNSINSAQTEILLPTKTPTSTETPTKTATPKKES